MLKGKSKVKRGEGWRKAVEGMGNGNGVGRWTAGQVRDSGMWSGDTMIGDAIVEWWITEGKADFLFWIGLPCARGVDCSHPQSQAFGQSGGESGGNLPHQIGDRQTGFSARNASEIREAFPANKGIIQKQQLLERRAVKNTISCRLTISNLAPEWWRPECLWEKGEENIWLECCVFRKLFSIEISIFLH